VLLLVALIFTLAGAGERFWADVVRYTGAWLTSVRRRSAGRGSADRMVDRRRHDPHFS
jgi:hypothetical protein